MKNLLCATLAFACAACAAKPSVEVVDGNNMPVVKASLDGVECLMLVDTGASHTTFDLGFATNSFPGAALQDVMLVGATNVATPPKFMPAKKLSVAGEDIPVAGVMVFDLSHLPKAVRRPVAGILGMDHMRHAPCLLSLKEGTLSWNPSDAAKKGFVRVPARARGNAWELAAKFPGGRIAWLLADTGSTFTFIDAEMWRKAGDAVSMSAAGVNGTAGETNERGVKGRVEFGPDFSAQIEPMLTPRKDLNQVGSDVFRNVDIYFDDSGVWLR
ncbi:MAG: retropepsin-like domain-containing protein [Kiritimatiellae bacterium]|nr:retropepsin-like domain-containing protein [Kiritimatiellia bacterium]